MKYLLSIIIPTKNRQQYCLAAIKQVLSLDNKHIQVVVQDNSDEPILKEKIQAFPQEQLKYNYNPSMLSFVDNFNEAVSLADGDYLCMIGDDDGILPNIVQIANYAKINQIEAVIPALKSVYFWPTIKPIIKGGENGYLILSYLNNKKQFVNPQKGLFQLLKNGGQNYQNYDLPRLYHGIIHRDIVELIKERTGVYFGGLTPDIYMATALAMVCKRVLRIGFPVTISGICNGSGSSNSATGKHTGQLKDAPHFIGHVNYQWSSKVPAIYSVETIWADTILHALEDFNVDFQDQFNIASLLAILNHKHSQFRRELNVFAEQKRISPLEIFNKRLHYITIPFMRRCAMRVVRRKNSVMKYYCISNIMDAVNMTTNELEKRHIGLDYNEIP